MSKPPDEDIIEQDYVGHTSAIGELCRQWALLDRMLSLLIETMAGVEEKTLACLTSTSRDTSQRCEIATRLAILKAPVVMIGLAVMAPRFKGGKSVMKLLAPPQPLLLLYKRYFPEPNQKTCPKPKRQPKSSRKK